MSDWRTVYTNTTSFLFAMPFLSISLNNRKPAVAALLSIILSQNQVSKTKQCKRIHTSGYIFEKFHCSLSWSLSNLLFKDCTLPMLVEGRTSLQPLFVFLVFTPSLSPSSYLGSESSEDPPPPEKTSGYDEVRQYRIRSIVSLSLSPLSLSLSSLSSLSLSLSLYLSIYLSLARFLSINRSLFKGKQVSDIGWKPCRRTTSSTPVDTPLLQPYLLSNAGETH